MSLHWIDWSIIAIYLLISLAIGLYYSRKGSSSMEHFFLGGRNMNWFLAGISLVATTFAADTPLAVTEMVVKNGISGNWLWWNFLLGGMLTTFFFAKLWRRSGVVTEPELIELRYSGREATFLRGFKAAYLGIFINSLVIGWVNLAMMTILEVFFGMNHTTALLYTGGLMLLTAGYASISGLIGVAVTDAVQFIIAIIGCIILAVVILQAPQIGGIEGLKAKISPESLSFFPTIKEGNVAGTLALGIGSFLAYTLVQWWASWYPGAEPGGGGYVVQRMMSTKDEKNALYATLFFQIMHYCLRPWPWIIVGLCSVVLYPGLAEPRYGYIMAIKDYMPVGLKGLLLVAFLAAYMSTISTQLNWGSSYIINDIYKRFLKPNATEKNLVNTSKLVTLLLMVVSLGITTQLQSISQVWSFLIECGAGLGLVLILRWYWWRINAWSEITATIAPFIAFAAAKWYGLPFPDSFFITVGFTTVAWLVATYATAPSSHEVLSHFYNKIQPQGVWGIYQKDNTQKSTIHWLLLCWVGSILMTYSVLFFMGKVIFAFYTEAAIWFFMAIIGFFMLRFGANKTKIFE